MTRKWAAALTVILFVFVLSAGNLFADTDNYILNICGGGAGYSTALLTDPDKIPILVIQPTGNTRLEDLSFQVRLLNAWWDFETFSSRGIANYGVVDKDGIFRPELGYEGYLTYRQSTPGVAYEMQMTDAANVVKITLDASTYVTSLEAIYIPIIAEITGQNPAVELYDDVTSDINFEGMITFASSSISGVTTQVKPGKVTEFSQSITFPDITVRELQSRAVVSGVMSIRPPKGYRWINTDQIQLAGGSGAGIKSRTVVTEGQNGVAELRLELNLDTNNAEPRSLIFRNLQMEAEQENSVHGSVSLSFAGCNMEKETVLVANRIRAYYRFTAEDRALPKLAAGVYHTEPAADSQKVLKVTFEEAAPGRWLPGRSTAFTLPEGIEARAVQINTYNLSTDLPKDTLLKRVDQNAFALSSESSGVWTLSANGLTTQNVTVKSGETARIEMTFYLSASESFRGPVYLKAGGAGMLQEMTTAVAEAVEKAAAGSVALTIGSTEMRVGGEAYTMDVAPFIEDGYTMVPVSYAARAMGIAAEGVSWDEETRSVTVKTKDKEAVLTIGSKEMAINGVVVEISKAPVIRDSRTFLPFRVLGEQVLGVAVAWDADTGTAYYL